MNPGFKWERVAAFGLPAQGGHALLDSNAPPWSQLRDKAMFAHAVAHSRGRNEYSAEVQGLTAVCRLQPDADSIDSGRYWQQGIEPGVGLIQKLERITIVMACIVTQLLQLVGQVQCGKNGQPVG